MENEKKKKNTKKEKKKHLPLKRTATNNLFALKMLWKGSPLYMIVYLGSSVVYGLLQFFSDSYLLRRTINGIQSGESIQNILTYVVILSVLTIILDSALAWFWRVISPAKWQHISAYIEKSLFEKAAQVELSCYENPDFYDKYVKAMDSAYNRMQNVMNTLDSLIYTAVSFSANSLLLFIIDPVLILFGLFPLLLGFIRRYTNVINHDLEASKKPINRRTEYARRTFYLGEYAKEMRIGGMYVNMLRYFRESYDDYRQLINKYGRRNAILQFVQSTGLEVVTILGAMLYAVWSTLCVGADSGGMLIGDCIVVIGSVGTISYGLNNFVQNIAAFGEHALFLEDVRYFLDYEPAIKDGVFEAPESGDIEVRNVSFSYTGSNKKALDDISFTWRKGERIALVGSNGSGKSTLVKLLLRLYDPSDGEITINGRNITEYKVRSYRDRYSTVLQDFKIFSMSVRDNVLLRLPMDGDEKIVEAALGESGAAERIDRLEKGIDTVLTREFDDKGANLSVGEQQKLSLAKVFASDTPFVILDEPSSALDPIAEYKMFENMMRATEGRNVIFISHRLSSATLADRVILMEGGKIAEIGTHEELLDLGGKYAEMFGRQAENYLGSEATENE